MVGDQGSNLREGTALKRKLKPFFRLAVYFDKVEAWQLLVSVEVEATGTGFGFGLGRSGCRASGSEWKRVGPQPDGFHAFPPDVWNMISCRFLLSHESYTTGVRIEGLH